jgi:alanyl-tRNA synthetase
VLAQRDQLKDAQHEVRGLKKEFWKAQLPAWAEQIEMVHNLPVLVLQLKDFAPDELKEIAHSLAQKRPGFYFVISASGDKSNFVATLDAQFASMLNLKNFAAWLKDVASLRGGVAQNSVQGGGGKFDASLKETILEWLRVHVS